MSIVIKYKICKKTEPDAKKETLHDVTMNWNEANEEIAKKEAYNGEYTLEDDGQQEPVTDAKRIAELEDALDMLLSGVTE